MTLIPRRLGDLLEPHNLRAFPESTAVLRRQARLAKLSEIESLGARVPILWCLAGGLTLAS